MNSICWKLSFLFVFLLNFLITPIWANINISCDPISTTIECAGQNSNYLSVVNWNEENITVLVNCSSSNCGNIAVTSDFDYNNLTDECGFTGFIRANYTISDGCDSLNKTATLTIVDTTDPSVPCEPDDRVLECIEDTANKADAMAWNQQNISKLVACASDFCGSVSVTSDFNYNNINLGCGVTGSILVTYTITDECGNFNTRTATFTIIDQTAPSVTCEPTTENHQCNGQEGNSFAALAWNENNLTILRNCSSDYCGGITVNSDYDFVNLSDGCALTGSITVTYTIADDCGNSITKTGTFTIEDTTAPLVACDPINATHECNGQEGNSFTALTWNNANIDALRNCSSDLCGVITVISDYDFANLSDGCALTGSITVTYTIADDCGNAITKTATFTIIDNEHPIVNCSPDNLTLDCKNTTENQQIAQQWNTQNINALANCSFDDCSTTFRVESDFDYNLMDLECEEESSLTVTYTIADECDNQITKQATLTKKTTEQSNCADINIQSINNQLTISNLTAPNTITKIFDPNWQIISNCSGDCPETVTIPDLIAGETYHTDIQFYDENWDFICEDKQDIEIIGGGSEPCDTSICAGDVSLRTQAEVDSFCGCEVIEGNFGIRNLEGNLNSDIHSLESLKGLKKVNGNFLIFATLLPSLEGLNELQEVDGAFTIVENEHLSNLEALSSLKEVKVSLIIRDNILLENLNGLNNLERIGFELKIEKSPNLLDISSLTNLIDLKGIGLEFCGIKNISIFKNIQRTDLSRLNFINCDNLTSLSGLENFQSVAEGLTVAANDVLTDITALKNITFLGGSEVVSSLTINNNQNLSDCCSITHLIDNNPSNGSVAYNVNISNNPQFCNSPEEILQNCQNQPTSTCENIQIITQNNQITIEGITAPNSIVKIFDPNWQIIFECTATCESEIVVPVVGEGLYHTDIQFYDENWQFICEDKQDVEVFDSGEPCDTSICAGDVILRTQADVDAFCGCAVIEGDLVLGIDGENENQITTISKLANLKSVKGNFYFIRTQLIDFRELKKLEFIGKDLAIIGNPILRNVNGLNSITSLNSLYVQENSSLLNFGDLDNLNRVQEFIVIKENNKLTSLSGLRKISQVNRLDILNNNSLPNLIGLESLVSTKSSFEIQENESLNNLKGLENFKNCGRDFIIARNPIINLNSLINLEVVYDDLAIVNNFQLVDLNGLENVKSIGNLNITHNEKLNNCCSISHLVDDNMENGIVVDKVVFNNNPQFCNSPEEILQNCQTPPSTCENIQIITQNNQIIIDGLTAPNEIVKVFDKNYNIVYQCNANCEDTQMAGTFPEGNYTIDLQLYDENWGFICAEQRTVILENTNPCDTSICQGDVVLRTQAEVDAFCGCAVIEGNLQIEGENINSIARLLGLRIVKGRMDISLTALENLKGLDELTHVEGIMVIDGNKDLIGLNHLKNLKTVKGVLAIGVNPMLENLKGLEKLEEIGSHFVLTGSERLNSLDDLKSLNFIGGGLDISTTGVESLNIFSQLEKNTLDYIRIISCPNIKSLDGLANSSIYEEIQINNNPLLNDISEVFIDVEEVTHLIIVDNPILNDCCSMVNLVDSDMSNGKVTGQLAIQNNAQFCNSPEEILQNCQTQPTSPCENIQINTQNNQITIEGITAPNSIIKVFDPNWQIIYECTATCENEIIVPVGGEGLYHTDIQFYDENWGFICADKQDVEIIGGGEPCDTSVCAGDVVLRTQAEVDAFCGCEVIEGNLFIGLPTVLNGTNDIFSLSSLKKVRLVKGRVNIEKTSLTSLKGLDELEMIGKQLSIQLNNNLTNFDGVDKLTKVGGFLFIASNPELKSISALKNIKEIGAHVSILENGKLESLASLSKITRLDFITIRGQDNITSLKGLEGLNRIEGESGFGLIISQNENLTDISALANLDFVRSVFQINFNPNLVDLCPITHLIDGDATNGLTVGIILVNNNAFCCLGLLEILNDCENSATYCETTKITPSENTLAITNLTAPIEIIKVFDANYNIVYQCFADCEENISIPDLAAGTYHIDVNFYDENWQPICEKNETVEIAANAQDRTTDLLPADFALFPNPAAAETYIDLSKLKGETVALELFHQFGQRVRQQVIEKVTAQKVKIDLATVQNGLYILKIEAKDRKPIAKKLIVNRLY